MNENNFIKFLSSFLKFLSNIQNILPKKLYFDRIISSVLAIINDLTLDISEKT